MTPALPAAGEVHVRFVRLDQEAACLGFLASEERDRAERFHFERDRQRWLAGRSALRRTLGAYLEADPGSFRFETGPWGKPGLRGCPLRFNVSHSGDTALLAFAWQQEVGVDVEKMRSDFAPEELGPQVFSATEQAMIQSVPLEQRPAAFLTLWTAKEAYVKARGEGLSFPVSRLTLTLLPGTDRFRAECSDFGDRHPEMSVCRLNMETGAFAALALEGFLSSVRHFGF